MREKLKLRLKHFKLIAIFTLLLGILSACGSSSSSSEKNGKSDGDKLQIRIGSIDAEGAASWEAINVFKEEMEKELGDKVEITIYPNSQLGTYQEMLEQVKNDSLEAVFESIGIMEGWSPLAGIETVPYLYEDEEHFFKIWRSDEADEFFDALAEDSGFRVVGPAYRGFRQLTINKPVENVEDLKGLKLRVPAIEAYANAWKALGVSPTPVDFEETYTAIQQGLVVGQENPLSIITDHRFYEVSDYLVLTNHMAETLGFMFNEEWYQSQDDEIKQAIEKAALASSDWYRDHTNEEEAKMIEEIKDHGVTVIEPDLAGFREKVADLEIKGELKPWVERLQEIK